MRERICVAEGHNVVNEMTAIDAVAKGKSGENMSVIRKKDEADAGWMDVLPCIPRLIFALLIATLRFF